MTSPLNANLPPNLPPIGPRRVVYLEANRPPTTADTKYRDGSYYEFNTEWRDKSTTPPNIYKLSNILSKTNAIWVLVSGGTGTIINIDVDAATAPGVDPVTPTGPGLITITGAQVATGTTANVIRTHTVALNQFNIEIQRTTTAASADVTLNGVSHFNSTQFTVDTDGFVSLAGGGAAIDSINVDAASAPGTDPVVPDGAGQITVTGAQVAPGTVGANVIRTDSLAANTYTIEIQQTDTSVAKDTTKNGVSHFNSAQFTDDEGFISMIAAGPPTMSFNVDANTGPGTDPVIPTAGGAVTITGGQVAAGTVGANAIRTDSLAANTYTVEIQRAAAAATSSVNNAGILSVDSSQFTVDTNGWLQLKNAINTDSFTNLSLSYSAGVFTISGYDGTALSASNPATIFVQDRSDPGKQKKYTVTANQTFQDAASGGSTISGNLFGTTAGTAWSSTLPFFVYACTNDAEDTVTFGISRVPHLSVAPVVADIGTPASATADNAWSMFLFSSVTIADYDGNPVLPFGSFRMTKSAADDWTVTALDTSDGVGQWQQTRVFTMPTGVLGASANTYFLPQGGTAPVFSYRRYNYTITRDGYCFIRFRVDDCTTAGVGANTLRCTPPYYCGIAELTSPGNAQMGNNVYAPFSVCVPFINSTLDGGGYNEIAFYPNNGTNVFVLNTAYTVNASWVLSFNVYYPIRTAS